MSMVPTQEELLTTQCDRILSLYDRGLIGLEELDAIRTELLDDTAREAVIALLEKGTCPRVAALLSGLPIPAAKGDEIDRPREGGGFDVAAKDMEADEVNSSVVDDPDSGTLLMVPFVMVVLIVVGIIWIVNNEQSLEEARATLSREDIAPLESPTPEPLFEEPTVAQDSEPESILLQEHPIGPVLQRTVKALEASDIYACFGTSDERLEEIGRKIRWNSPNDEVPWSRKGEFFVGEDDDFESVQFTVLRESFPEIGPSGLTTIGWYLEGDGDALMASFSKLFDGQKLPAPGGSVGCMPEKSGRSLCWWLERKERGVLFQLSDAQTMLEMERLKLALAKPIGTYTSAKSALHGPSRDLSSSLSLGRTALAEFGAVHPRIFHGHTVVNLCRAHLMAGERREARVKCQMAMYNSQEPEVRAEARFLMARLSLWENAGQEAKSLLEEALEDVRGRRLKLRIKTYLNALSSRDKWEKSTGFSLALEWVGCATGRSLGASWRWLPMEFGFRDARHMLERGKEVGLAGLEKIYQDAMARCHAGSDAYLN